MLSTEFMLRLLLTAVYAQAGLLRVRGDQEQLLIFMRDFRLPPLSLTIIAVWQLLAAIFSLVLGVPGYLLTCFMATLLILCHVVRQRIPLASVLDVLALSLACVNAYIDSVPMLYCAAAVFAGGLAFLTLHQQLPMPTREVKSR